VSQQAGAEYLKRGEKKHSIGHFKYLIPFQWTVSMCSCGLTDAVCDINWRMAQARKFSNKTNIELDTKIRVVTIFNEDTQTFHTLI
jgi:hypothetical protein